MITPKDEKNVTELAQRLFDIAKEYDLRPEHMVYACMYALCMLIELTEKTDGINDSRLRRFAISFLDNMLREEPSFMEEVK